MQAGLPSPNRTDRARIIKRRRFGARPGETDCWQPGLIPAFSSTAAVRPMFFRVANLKPCLGLLLLAAGATGCGQSGAPAPAADSAAQLTFADDIRPIISRHCSVCHQPGQAAPFALLSYDDVVQRLSQIVEVTTHRSMPPWLPEPGDTPFVGERRLSEEQIEMLATWAAAGAPQGLDEEISRPAVRSGWRMGAPDLVVDMPRPYTLPAEGGDLFRNFVIPVTLDRRQYIKGVEIRPSNPKVIHHAVLLVDATPTSRELEREHSEPGFAGMQVDEALSPAGHFIGWVPGKSPTILDEDMAWRLDEGADLVLQLHMIPSGKPEIVQASVGLYFTEQPPTRTPVMIRLGSQTLDIPAGNNRYEIEDVYTLPVDVTATAVIPHAHYLCREMIAYADLPGEGRKDLIHIREWDFNWQDEYRFVEPVLLPQGALIRMRYTYDNSPENPQNPNSPPRRVQYGPQTSDEMGDLWVQVVPVESAELVTLQRDAHRKRLETDIRGYVKLLSEQPDHGPTHHALALAYQKSGNASQAISHFRKTLALAPDAATACNNLALLLQSQGQVREAIQYYRRALEVDPDYAKAHYNLGLLLQRMGQSEAAADHYRAALDARPYFADAHNNLGNIDFDRGALEQALQSYQQALAIDPEHARAHLNIGNLFHLERKLDRAKEHFRQAIQRNPSFAEPHYRLGVVVEQQGQFSQAVACYRRAIQIRPDHAEAHYRIASPLIRLGKPVVAITHLNKALDLRPKWPPPRNNLAWVLATHPDSAIRDGREAVRHAELAAEYAGRREAGYLDTLAAAHAETGNFDEAIRIAEEAVGLAVEGGADQLAEKLKSRLGLYRQRQAYRDAD